MRLQASNPHCLTYVLPIIQLQLCTQPGEGELEWPAPDILSMIDETACVDSLCQSPHLLCMIYLEDLAQMATHTEGCVVTRHLGEFKARSHNTTTLTDHRPL
jgi:hypothetical protein